MHRHVLAATLVALAACSPQAETWEQAVARMRAESDSARTIIEEKNARFVRYIGEGKADSAALNYALDAVVMLPNEPPVRGRAAIQAKLAEWVTWGTWQFTVTTERVEAVWPMAVEWGTYVWNFTPGPNAPPGMATLFPDSGKYVTYWRDRDGGWTIVADISNTSRPMPAPPVTTRR